LIANSVACFSEYAHTYGVGKEKVMSELMEQYEDCTRELRLIKAIRNLPVIYHPNEVVRVTVDGRSYRTGVCRSYLDVAASQPAVDVSGLKIEAIIDEGIAARKLSKADRQIREHYKSIPPIELPAQSLGRK